MIRMKQVQETREKELKIEKKTGTEERGTKKRKVILNNLD